MKSLEFIYQETKIHFLLGNEGNVMVNATEMGKAFGKEPKDFLRLEGTKTFIDFQLKKLNIGADVPRYTRENIVTSNNKAGTFMHRKLALKFAAWLDVEFEDWIFDLADSVLFGNYKIHWEAHMAQEVAKLRMEDLKKKILLKPDVESVQAYFEAERDKKTAESTKIKAIREQYKLFDGKNEL